MDTIIEYLEQLDLSDIEAKLYVTLLKKGTISVRDLAQAAGIKRTTAYLYVDQLIEKGLIIKVVKGAQKQVATTNPDILQDLVTKKTQNAKMIEQQFPKIRQMIHTTFSQNPSIDEAEIIYYKGHSGVRKIYENALKAKELRSYANLSKMKGIFPENVDLFANISRNNKDLKIYEIVEDSDISREETKLFSQNKQYSYKFLPSNITITSSDILIYDNKVGIINVEGKVSGVILHNADYANISRELFAFMWSVLPEVKKRES